jgi:hypothetical protein
VDKDSAAHCNAGFFPPIVVASGYFGYMGYHQFYLGALGLQVVAFGFVWFVGCGCPLKASKHTIEILWIMTPSILVNTYRR